jgi:hypothetical protein
VHLVPAGAPIFTPGTDLAKEFAELEPKEGEKVIGKEQPGAFTGTDLEECIRGTGRSKVVLTGYMAHVCVSTTARQADEKGFEGAGEGFVGGVGGCVWDCGEGGEHQLNASVDRIQPYRPRLREKHIWSSRLHGLGVFSSSIFSCRKSRVELVGNPSHHNLQLILLMTSRLSLLSLIC